MADTAALLDAVPRGNLDLSVLVSVQRRMVPSSNPYRGRLRDRPAVIMLNGKIHSEMPGAAEAHIMAAVALRSLDMAIESGTTRSDPVGTASAVTLGLLEAHPFFDGNGRVARAVANWILQCAGYFLTSDPRTYCRMRQSDYYQALAARHRAKDPDIDSSAWRLFFEDLVAECYEPLAMQ